MTAAAAAAAAAVEVILHVQQINWNASLPNQCEPNRRDPNRVSNFLASIPTGGGMANMWRATSSSSTKDRVFVMRRVGALGHAMDVLFQFDVLLIMEWLSYAAPTIQQNLGFCNTQSLTQHTRPHIQLFPHHIENKNNLRNKNKNNQNSHNKKDGGRVMGGSLGADKANWDPGRVMNESFYGVVSESLALDEVLMDGARWIFQNF